MRIPESQDGEQIDPSASSRSLTCPIVQQPEEVGSKETRSSSSLVRERTAFLDASLIKSGTELQNWKSGQRVEGKERLIRSSVRQSVPLPVPIDGCHANVTRRSGHDILPLAFSSFPPILPSLAD